MTTPINDKLDELSNFTVDCFEYAGQDSPEVACITSLQNFVYTCKQKYLANGLNFFEINRLLRFGKLPSIEAVDFNDHIKKAPTLPFDMILYRGLPETFDCKVGDVLQNQGFMFCTLYKACARWYAENTTSFCYTPTNLDISLAKPSNKSTLLRITVRKGTPFFDRSFIDYNCGGMLDSEIILSYEQKLQVTSIENDIICCETF
jgi:hypothetical protein